MTKSRKQFPLRISADLYKTYAKWAADELRSVNAQIEISLLNAAKKAGRLKKQK